jgi:hypothetical protein
MNWRREYLPLRLDWHDREGLMAELGARIAEVEAAIRDTQLPRSRGDWVRLGRLAHQLGMLLRYREVLPMLPTITGDEWS